VISSHEMREAILRGEEEARLEEERAQQEAEGQAKKSPTETLVDQRLVEAFGTVQAESPGIGMRALKSAMVRLQEGERVGRIGSRLSDSRIPYSSNLFEMRRDWDPSYGKDKKK
jgi:hypothetical protein